MINDLTATIATAPDTATVTCEEQTILNAVKETKEADTWAAWIYADRLRTADRPREALLVARLLLQHCPVHSKFTARGKVAQMRVLITIKELTMEDEYDQLWRHPPWEP